VHGRGGLVAKISGGSIERDGKRGGLGKATSNYENGSAFMSKREKGDMKGGSRNLSASGWYRDLSEAFKRHSKK